MSTFFGLQIGKSALGSFQVAVNTTANNVANLQTPGYSRQTATLKASDPIQVTARYGSVGTGVRVTAINQERNLYYDTKYWENNSSYGRYEQRLYYLEQIQNYFKDDGTVKGFSSIFADMFASLDTLKTNSADLTVRNQFVNKAQSLCTYFNQMYQNLSELQDDCNEEIKNSVDEINSISEKIALLNKEINQVETGTGAYASDLRDERANLVDKLSKIVNVTYTETEIPNTNGDNLGGTDFYLYINGEICVQSKEFRTLRCESIETKNNQTDNDGLYRIYWNDTQMEFSTISGQAGGSLRALFEMRDGDNAQGFKGKVVDADELSFTVENTSIEELNALNLPHTGGKITVNNIVYEYDSWEASVDKDGKILSVKFNLNDSKRVINPEKSVQNGHVLIAGSDIESRGIPYYMAQINEFVRNFAELFNDIESTGQDLHGNMAPTFFEGITKAGVVYDFEGSKVYKELADGDKATVTSDDNTYYRMTAGNFSINTEVLGDVSRFGATVDYTKTDAYDVIDKLLKLQANTVVYRGDKAESFLETLISDISVDTEKADTYTTLYMNLERTIDLERNSVKGVDEDEEAINLVKFQNAYNMASKVISVMQELLDKLINETGVS